MMKNILIWYRNDLRTHDHEPLFTAIKRGYKVAAFYCFQPAKFTQTHLGFPRVDSFRAKFLIDSIIDLRSNLAALGITLYVRVGDLETEATLLAKNLQINEVYFHTENTSEEEKEELVLESALRKNRTVLNGFYGGTLFHKEDLPFPIKHLPDLFTDFRKMVETESSVRQPLPKPPIGNKIVSDVFEGDVPTLRNLGLEEKPLDARSAMVFMGGEQAAQFRLRHFIWESKSILHYKQTRNDMLGSDYSSKLSPWLANGCLSARMVYAEVKRFESQNVKNESTYWLIFELIWRDFFRFVAMKYHNDIFKPGGIRKLGIPWIENKDVFELWKLGRTGFSFIDANMRELYLTGYMSNRGRQNVASFLTKNLGINWQWGAAWFESQLIDFDPCSNYGNWNYIAGIGNDARGFRYFNILKQASDYDPKGLYVKHWIPELNTANSSGNLAINTTCIEHGYLKPIVDLEKSMKINKLKYENAMVVNA
jgi:deoxyribodipyrimidine photo-lyase